MVRNLDDLDFHLPSHAQDMLEGLQRLRSLPKLADVTLLVGDQELPCHRSLLALNSPYFHAMFAGDFTESFSARVELQDVEPAMVGQLVDFVYTGRLTITQTNVEALTRSASRLHFPTVQKVCGRYLQQQLDATNCLGICEFGEQQGLLGVAAKAWAFLRENFEAVAQEDEFLQLPRDRLATCLASDLLQVQPEQSRLEALLRWVRHDPQDRAAHLPELLSLVHLDAVPRPCVQQLLATEPLIQESEACQEALSQGHSAGLPGLPQKMQEVLVVVGGRALEEDEDGGEEPSHHTGNFAFYNTKARQWMALPDFPDYHKWGFSLAALNSDVYVTGGSRGTKTDTWSTTQAWCFPLKEAIWKPVAPMLKARTNHASTALNGEIYAIGGTALDAVEVERYDPYTDSWAPVGPAPKYVSNFSAAGCQGRLYLVGSSACKYNMLALQCYSPVTDAWSVIASPFLPKYLSSPRCAALNGALYLIGDNTKKVYVYDPGANLWQKVQSQHSLHENGALVPLGDLLYVTGGRWQGMDGDYHVEMEAYDTEPTIAHAHSVDPRDAWMLFVKQSDKGINSKRRSKARRLKLGLPGPPGPPGPQGPPGPFIPSEVLLKEFQLLLKGAVRQRESHLEHCTRDLTTPASGSPSRVPAAQELDSQDPGALLALLAATLAQGPRAPRVEAAFHCRLRRDVQVERRALHELGIYYLPEVEGAFRRGPGLNLTSGQYTAPVAGFYALAATLHVALTEQPRKGPTRPRDRLRLLICIQSLCQHNASLETVMGLENSSELFTISVNGVLYLQAGHYTSVFLDNASGSSLTVRSGSHFSAILLGL